jgi:hypothetical protein
MSSVSVYILLNKCIFDRPYKQWICCVYVNWLYACAVYSNGAQQYVDVFLVQHSLNKIKANLFQIFAVVSTHTHTHTHTLPPPPPIPLLKII